MTWTDLLACVVVGFVAGVLPGLPRLIRAELNWRRVRREGLAEFDAKVAEMTAQMEAIEARRTNQPGANGYPVTVSTNQPSTSEGTKQRSRGNDVLRQMPQVPPDRERRRCSGGL